MNINNTNDIPVTAEPRNKAIHPHDKVDWRKRLTSVSRYIAELEDCLEEARSIIVTQKKQLERFNLNCGEANFPDQGGAR